MVTTPAVIPVKTPVAGFIAAIEGLLQDHVPPVVESKNVTFAPAQTSEGPSMGPTCAPAATEMSTDNKVRVINFIKFFFKVIKPNCMLSICCFTLCMYKA